MKRRSLTLKEKQAVQATTPSLNIDNWLIVKKKPGLWTLKHKDTGTKRNVFIT